MVFASTILCRMTGAIVLEISYGYRTREEEDPLIRMAEEATDQASEVAKPGAYFVDVFPIRKSSLLVPCHRPLFPSMPRLGLSCTC